MHLVQVFHDVTLWVLDLVGRFGYGGVFVGMMLQATGFVPIPSEVTMSFAGYLANTHKLELWLVILMGTAGDAAGAIIAYVIGYYGGRPFLERFGRAIFVRPADLARADRWFERFGSRAVFICKLLPGIRAIAALPAGITRMHVAVFLGYTTAGSLIWCGAFATLGFTLGRNWTALEPFFRRFSILLIALLVAAVGYWIWSHFRAEKQAAKA
jgi:membrane protein DedA with SNARE-associated domain